MVTEDRVTELDVAVQGGQIHADTNYSIWEGWDLEGYPVTTILRGKVIVEDGQLMGSSDDGKFIERKIADDVLKRPAC